MANRSQKLYKPVSLGSYMTKAQLLASRRWHLAKPESLLYQTTPSCLSLLTTCRLIEDGVTGHELVLAHNVWEPPKCKAQIEQCEAWRNAPDDAVIRIEVLPHACYYPTDIKRLCTRDGEYEIIFNMC